MIIIRFRILEDEKRKALEVKRVQTAREKLRSSHNSRHQNHFEKAEKDLLNKLGILRADSPVNADLSPSSIPPIFSPTSKTPMMTNNSFISLFQS